MQTSAIILQCSGADLAIHLYNFRLHLAFIVFSFLAYMIRHSVLLHQHPQSTHIFLCLGDVGVERQKHPSQETLCQENAQEALAAQVGIRGGKVLDCF